VKRTFVFAAVALTFAAVSAQANAAKLVGYISDSMCGAKHVGTGAACVKKCIEGGMAPVFVDVKSKSVWKIDNPDSVKDYYGAKVVINGTADDSAKSVHIDSVAAAK
jgi:hypothetical protein